MTTELGIWASTTPRDVAGLLAKFPCPWWIAGGWAIELHLQLYIRSHADIDVIIQRDDQNVLRQALADWDCHVSDPPGTLRPWRSGEYLKSPIQDIWCRPDPDAKWAVQFMLVDVVRGNWVFKRDPRILRPVSDIGLKTTVRRLGREQES